jgi:hypothetical protein
MANYITFPVQGTAAFGSATVLTIGTTAILDATTIARIEPLSATTTAIHFNQSPTAGTQKLVLTHTSTPILVNPLTGVNQFPVKDGIQAALTGTPTTPTIAVQIPAYVTGTAAAPVYTIVKIESGVWS